MRHKVSVQYLIRSKLRRHPRSREASSRQPDCRATSFSQVSSTFLDSERLSHCRDGPLTESAASAGSLLDVRPKAGNAHQHRNDPHRVVIGSHIINGDQETRRKMISRRQLIQTVLDFGPRFPAARRGPPRAVQMCRMFSPTCSERIRSASTATQTCGRPCWTFSPARAPDLTPRCPTRRCAVPTGPA